MLKLRTDVAYSGTGGKLTQAGVEAIQGQFDAQATAVSSATTQIAALDGRVTAAETTLAGSLIKLQSAVAASSQTSIDFTGVPSWVNRVTVLFAGLSTNGTSNILVRIGDSGGVETTGYNANSQLFAAGGTATIQSTAGFILGVDTAAGVISGVVSLLRQSGNLWVASGTYRRISSSSGTTQGDKTLSATLDRVRITTEIGTQTFDAGSVSISWE